MPGKKKSETGIIITEEYIRRLNPDTWVAFTDGSSKNPGPSGSGVVLMIPPTETYLERMNHFVTKGDDALGDPELGEWKFISRGIGNGTNNIAELKGIEFAMIEIMQHPRFEKECEYVCILSDSKYALGVIFQGWTATKNTGLVSQIRDTAAKLKSAVYSLQYQYIEAHSKHCGNEMADRLAKEGAKESAKFKASCK